MFLTQEEKIEIQKEKTSSVKPYIKTLLNEKINIDTLMNLEDYTLIIFKLLRLDKNITFDKLVKFITRIISEKDMENNEQSEQENLLLITKKNKFIENRKLEYEEAKKFSIYLGILYWLDKNPEVRKQVIKTERELTKNYSNKQIREYIQQNFEKITEDKSMEKSIQNNICANTFIMISLQLLVLSEKIYKFITLISKDIKEMNKRINEFERIYNNVILILSVQ